jgi:hypothetical protein
VKRIVKHHAVIVFGDLLDLEGEVFDDPLEHRAPGTEVGGGGLQCGDAAVLLGVDVLEIEVLQRATGGLQVLEAEVDGGVPIRAVAVEVDESVLPLGIVVVESAAELLLGTLDLLQDHLQVWLHGSERSLERGEVLVRWI